MYYQNKQYSIAILLLMAVSIVLMLLFGLSESRITTLLAPIAILSVVSFLFSSLNIIVDNSSVQWYFGPGFWKKSIALSEIESVKVVTLKWYYGLGIRLIPTGWLYNVSGLKAVEISLNDGKKVSVGSNEPDKLLKAITERLRSS